MGATQVPWSESWADDVPPGHARIEWLIAWIRFAVTVGVVVVVVLPPRASPYPSLAVAAALVTLGYGLLGLGVVRQLADGDRGLGPTASRRFVLADTALSLVLVGLTGAGTSLLLGVMMLITIEVAMRFPLRETAALTAFVASGAAAVILLVPLPAVGWEERLQATLWWVGLLVWSAAMVAALARLLLDEQRQRARVEAQQLTERRELAREREQRCRLEELERERKEFLHVLHHELRTPAASMEALSRAVVRDTRLDDAHRERMLDLIQAHARHLTTVLDELRTVATVGTGTTRREARTDVSAVELVHLAAHAAGVDDADLQVHVADPLLVLRVDAEKLRRVLTNLVENANRHSPPGEPIDVALTLGDDRLSVTVRDRGPGVSEAQAADMFGKFVSVGERRGTSGLGLWIVGELVKAMDGTVRAHDHPEGGLEVVVELPAADVVVPSFLDIAEPEPTGPPRETEEVRP